MKARQVLIFIIAVFVLLGLSWAIAPAGTVEAGPLELRFPSYRRSVAEASTLFKGSDLYLLDSIDVGEYAFGSELKREFIKISLGK